MPQASSAIAAVWTAALVLFLAGPVRADTPIGIWETGESHVEIYRCGEMFCGRIVALDEPLDKDGRRKTDRNNPDPVLRSRPLIGLDLIIGFTREGDDEWAGGTIYDPRNGKTYKCRMSLQEDGSLKVRGYVAIPLFGRTVVWTRAE